MSSRVLLETSTVKKKFESLSFSLLNLTILSFEFLAKMREVLLSIVIITFVTLLDMCNDICRINRMWLEASGFPGGKDSRRKGRTIWRMAVAGLGSRGDLARFVHEKQVRRCAYH